MLKRKSAWQWPRGYGHTDALRKLAIGASVVLSDTDGNTLRALMHSLYGAGSYTVRRVVPGRYRVTRLGAAVGLDEL